FSISLVSGILCCRYLHSFPTRRSSDLILVAFDQETIDLNYHELHDSGIILADTKFSPKCPEDTKATMYAVPFTEIATELGTSLIDRKSTRLNSSHVSISYAVFCLKKKK